MSDWPTFSIEEADAVRDVLLSNKVNYWTGDECRQFEQEFSEWVGTQYAVALANGTLALEFSLKALGITESSNCEVIVTSRTFLASVSAIVNVGARPVFADVDYESQNITRETVESAISDRTRAIICVHLAGWPCEMDQIMELAQKHDLYVIEDCAQAHGARYRGRSVGFIGDIGCWSFCQDKIMTTGGEGGMITTNNRVFWSKIWSYKDHGKSWEAVYEQHHPSKYGFKWLHDSFGTNGRMTEMQAVIGRIQLKYMRDWKQVRTENANVIMGCFDLYPELFRVPRPPAYIEHAWYKCYIFVKSDGLERLGLTRDQIIEQFNEAGIPCYQGSCSEVYLEKAFDGTSFRPKQRLPVAKALGETSLMFLVHPGVDSDRVKSVLLMLLSRLN